MADVTKIPGLPQEPSPREPMKPGSKKFQDLMKVGESEKQKKQKKQKRQSEEETKASMRTGALTPEKLASTKPEKYPKIQKVGESEKKQPKQGEKRSEEAAAMDEVAAANISREKIQALNLDQVETASLEKKGTNVPPPSYEAAVQQEEAEEEKQVEEKKVEFEKAAARQQAKKEEKAQQPPQTPPASTALGPHFIAPAPETAPGYMQLKAEAFALFERMVSQIFVMQTNGMKETTLHLDTPNFASSMFAGAQIIIREFSTAPLAYNIEFLGSPQSALYFDQNIAGLRAAFASEKRNFTVNRIESRIQKSEKTPRHKGNRKEEDEDQAL
jgi:hypothetical protein